MNNPMILKELQSVQYSSGASEDGSPKSTRHHNSQERLNKPLKLDVSDKKWFLASSQCHMAKLKELHSIDSTFINKKDFFTGYSALHWASKEGKSELVHWLCDATADVNLKSNGGYTPLHLAVISGKATIVDILITDYEADINMRDYSGRKPSYYAQSDAPNWVQRALRANQPVDLNRFDPSMIFSTVSDTRKNNLSVMHARPISRSWGSFKYETAAEDGAKSSPEHKEKRDNGTRSRTKSLVQSFRRLRNKDKMHRSKESGEKKLRLDDRSKSVPEVCYTPRSKAKHLQIEHPHFEGASSSLVNGEKQVGNCDTNANRHTEASRDIEIKRNADENQSIDVANASFDSNRGISKRRDISTDNVIDASFLAAAIGGVDVERDFDDNKCASPNGSFGLKSPVNAKAKSNDSRTASPRNRKAMEKSSSKTECNGALKDRNANQWPVSTLV